MKKITFLILLVWAGIMVSAQTITTNIRMQYQVIDGFGCAYNAVASDTATAHLLLEDLGLTIMRTYIPTGFEYMDDDGIPFDTGAYAGRYNRNTFRGNPFELHADGFAYNDNGQGSNACVGNGDLEQLIPFMLDIQNASVKFNCPYKLFASDFSPPGWMKYLNCIFGTDPTWNRVDNGMGPQFDYENMLGTYSPNGSYSKGEDVIYTGTKPYQRFEGGQVYQYKAATASSGHLPTDTAYWFLDERKNMYLELAEYHAGYVDLLQQNGVSLYGLSLQNEPLFPEWYMSCVYTYGQYRDALQAHDSMFAFHHLNVKMIGPEVMADNSEPWTSILFSDPVANKRLDIFAVHGYTNGIVASPADSSLWGGLYANVASSGKHLWMTETSGYAENWTDTGAFGVGKAIFTALKDGHVNAWVWEELNAGSEEGTPYGQPLMINLTPTSKYYVSKLFYRYVRPGAVMVDVQSNDTSILPLCFVDGGNAQVTYVFINKTSEEKTAAITLNNLPLNVAAYRSSSSENCVPVSVYSSGSVTLKAQSITTIVFSGTNKSPVINKPSDTTILKVNGQCNITLTGISDGDNDGNKQTVTLTTTSSNTAVIPTPALTKLTDSTYSLTFTPLTDTGTVTVTVNLTDNGSTDLLNSSFTTFKVTVIPYINKAPTIDTISDQNFSYVSNKKYTIPLSGISDGNNGNETLTLTLSSSNNAILRSLKVNYSAKDTVGSITFYGLATGTSTFTLEVQNSGGTDLGGQNTTIVSFGVTLSLGSELNASEGKQLSVYPVPASDYINLTLPDETFREIIIVDITGRVVLQQSVTSSTAVINVESLAKGVYIVIAKNDQEVLQTKITKE